MWFLKKANEDESRARAYSEEGQRRANEIMDRVKGRFLAECLTDLKLADFIARSGELLVISFELQFLWGFFHEYVQTESFPTNGYDRIKLHLLQHLVSVHGYEIQKAAAEANSVEDLFNEGDVLFKEISDLGRRSFKTPVDQAMIIAFRAIADQQISN